MPTASSLFLGLSSLGLAAWLSLELRKAVVSGEIQLFRIPGGEFPDRRGQPIFYWAWIGWMVLVVLGSSMVTVELLFGVDLRWWL